MRTRRPHRLRLWVEELEGRLVPAALSFSTNWSGYAIVGGAHAINAVAGSWTVPAVAHGNGYSATWVGIDGFNSHTVEQIGTESDFINGQASYYAWYEMYPNPTVVINQPIQPGDTINASVQYAAGTGFTLSIQASSWTSPFTQTVQSAAPRTSAEWVVEAPSMGNRVLPLANFGTETFSGATATVGGTSGSIKTMAAQAPVKQVDMVTGAGTLKAATSALTPLGTGFTVTFDSSGSRAGTVLHQAAAGRGGTSHDVNAPVTFVVVIIPTGPTITPLLLNFAPVPQPPLTAPLPPLTVTAPPPIATPTLLDPFYGTPGVSDVVPAGDGNGAPGGAIPAGPAVPQGQNGPVLPAGPQLRLDGIATPSARSMVLPEGNEGAAMVQDDHVTSRDLSDYTERTVEVAGIVLTLALSGSCGVSIGERTARVKPGDAEQIPLRLR